MTELVYAGIIIRRRDDMLCLTDMWKADGAIPSRVPAEWLRSAQGGQFVTFISESLNMGDSHVLDIRQGRGGGTWAHWQIGMAYAQYLSPEFHAWCNSVVRAHMEGGLVAAPSAMPAMNVTFDSQAIAQLGQAIGAELRAGFLNEVMSMFQEHGQRLQAVEDALRMQRRQISDSVKAEIAAETARQGRLCPCCMQVEVVDSTGGALRAAEFDHFFASHMADADSCWLICISCHNEITPWRASDTKTHKSDVTAQFEAFQNRRRRWRRPG